MIPFVTIVVVLLSTRVIRPLDAYTTNKHRFVTTTPPRWRRRSVERWVLVKPCGWDPIKNRADVYMCCSADDETTVSNNNDNKDEHRPIPNSYWVTIQESSTGVVNVHLDRINMIQENSNKRSAPSNRIATAAASDAATAIWRWCKDFVVPYGLCPWAPGSVSTEGSIQIFLVDDDDDDDDDVIQSVKYPLLLYEIAMRFLRSIHVEKNDPNKAIFFVLFLHESMMDFEVFYNWYMGLEDDWEKADVVTLAPFHPNWTYGNNNDEPLFMEKRSPYPMVSLVATSVIDRAGVAATQRIATRNEQILCQKSTNEWLKIYNTAIQKKNCTVENRVDI